MGRAAVVTRVLIRSKEKSLSQRRREDRNRGSDRGLLCCLHKDGEEAMKYYVDEFDYSKANIFKISARLKSP